MVRSARRRRWVFADVGHPLAVGEGADVRRRLQIQVPGSQNTGRCWRQWLQNQTSRRAGPVFRVLVSESAVARASISSAIRSMISARSDEAVWDHDPVVNAACAASTAALTSSSFPTGTGPQAVLVAESVTSMMSLVHGFRARRRRRQRPTEL